MFLSATELVQLDVQVLSLVAGVLVPLLVGVVSKLEASSRVKAILNLGLSAAAGALATAIEAKGSIELKQWISGIGMTWLTSIVSYYGLWKPVGAAPAVSEATRNFGIGSPEPGLRRRGVQIHVEKKD